MARFRVHEMKLMMYQSVKMWSDVLTFRRAQLSRTLDAITRKQALSICTVLMVYRHKIEENDLFSP